MINEKIKEYEKYVISTLLAETVHKGIDLPDDKTELEIDYSGVGYFLSFQNDKYSEERVVLDKPNVSGYLGGKHVGFVAFIEKSVFTLECYTYSDTFTPTDRDGSYTNEST